MLGHQTQLRCFLAPTSLFPSHAAAPSWHGGLGVLPLLLQCFVPGAVSQMSSADQSGHGAASSISTAASNPSSPCASPALLGEPTVVFVQAAPQKPSSTQVPAVQRRGSFIIPGVSIPSLHEALCCYSRLCQFIWPLCSASQNYALFLPPLPTFLAQLCQQLIFQP